MRTLALISTASALLHSQAPLRSSTPLSAIDITNRGYVRIDTEKETVAHPKAAPVLDEVSLRKCVDEAPGSGRGMKGFTAAANRSNSLSPVSAMPSRTMSARVISAN